MNISEACKILNVAVGSSLDDAKSKYRDLAKKMHPDVNKDPDATDKFKRINEAFSFLQQNAVDGVIKEEEPKYTFNSEDFGFESFIKNNFHGFNTPRQKQRPEILIPVFLTFAESVTGCPKEISYNRIEPCDYCRGTGNVKKPNSCGTCNGNGFIDHENRNGGTVTRFRKACRDCLGRNNMQSCSSCRGDGGKESKITLQVKITPGIPDGSILRLAGVGHYSIGPFGGTYTDAHVKITVKPSEEGMWIDGNNVCSKLEISLLEAVVGKTINTNTIFGNKELIIPKLSKHTDKISLPGCGVGRVGNHVVILDVKYPDNIESLLKE